MTTWIALFRGINVGGNNILPMAKLKSDLEALKLKNVRTYIQSGNVVFEATATSGTSLAKRIADRVENQHGFRPQVVLLNRDDLRTAVESNPFPQAVSHPQTLQFFFLAKPPVAPNLRALEDVKSPTENYRLTERVFYLHAPNGIGRSKLAANAEKHLGVATTARNYRTVVKLLDMIDE
jgi:uncharacterized protein (DUF1697 family)